MVSHRYSFRSAHLVMWSSPLLLLVLVFTLTNSTKAPASIAAINHHSTTRSSTVGAPTTSAPAPTTSTPAPTTSTVTRSTVTRSTVTRSIAKTSEANAAPYSKVTSSTVRSVALALSANVSSGALEGSLNHAFPTADVPLQGPGSWTLTTSAKVRSLLECKTLSATIVTRVIIKNNQSCQLEITSIGPEVSQTWQLTPTP